MVVLLIQTRITVFVEVKCSFSLVDPIFDLPNFMLSTVTLMCV
jgi:hypothetical protein